MEDPLGEHYIIELYDCNKSVLNDLDVIQGTLLSAAERAGATIIDSRFHRFAPQGVSGVIVIAESHLSIHTWPELGYAALDFYTCNHDMDIESSMRMLTEAFQASDFVVEYMPRGILNPARRRELRLQEVNFDHLKPVTGGAAC
ncbi:MAG: adenosylmethionine decarboxylase [Leptonema illini]|jgi:S-adenosylmethionine decarboxylase proenzyme|uniref:S-adenosylmethionine decarboxylase proenzyme n=2 Tax=Leptonema illini TaxID=183 RepID=H2CC29_9LEPT|nr:adenosylmethionine decarboxylase [Leptonema illini]EHQ05258.1 adenosylmethionine decarboxylase proenzyme [Leptonema illini DSM 21528]KAB2932201.1 MAG: adenosylmethionine decarboxylase [Leptonema illini]PKL30489.1 MAG: adenosylmethionine decarboxylase [Spirochaetae bacterium HGW-Spirochaetae-10]